MNEVDVEKRDSECQQNFEFNPPVTTLNTIKGEQSSDVNVDVTLIKSLRSQLNKLAVAKPSQ